MPSKRKGKYPRVIWCGAAHRLVQVSADHFTWEDRHYDALGCVSWRLRCSRGEALNATAELEWRLSVVAYALCKQIDKHERLKRSRRRRRRK